MEKSQFRRKTFIPKKNVHSGEKSSFQRKKSDQNKKNQRQNENRDLFNGKTTICARKTQ